MKQGAETRLTLSPKGPNVFPTDEEGTAEGLPGNASQKKDPACLSKLHEPRKAVGLGYAPSRCGPGGQHLLKCMQVWLHRELSQEAVLSEEGEVPSPSALQVERQHLGRQARGRKGEGAGLAHPFNRQAVIMTELRSPAASQPALLVSSQHSNCCCCRHWADETTVKGSKATKTGRKSRRAARGRS